MRRSWPSCSTGACVAAKWLPSAGPTSTCPSRTKSPSRCVAQRANGGDVRQLVGACAAASPATGAVSLPMSARLRAPADRVDGPASASPDQVGRSRGHYLPDSLHAHPNDTLKFPGATSIWPMINCRSTRRVGFGDPGAGPQGVTDPSRLGQDVDGSRVRLELEGTPTRPRNSSVPHGSLSDSPSRNVFDAIPSLGRPLSHQPTSAAPDDGAPRPRNR